MAKREFIQSLEAKLPNIICRKDVTKLSDGLVASKTLANLDSLGEGPEQRFLLNRKVCYPKQAFIDWLLTRCTDC